MQRQELARRIATVARLTGRFRLRSGRISDVYWDKYRFESDPVLLDALSEALAWRVRHLQFDRFAGLELGGIPLATALALRTGVPCAFVRKEPKAYGTCNLIEGGVRGGERLLVVEDVITTAGQVVQSVEKLRSLGLEVREVLCVIDRQAGGRERLEGIGCRLHALFTVGELEEAWRSAHAAGSDPATGR